MTIGEKIRKKRLEKNLTKQQLGILLGASEVSSNSLIRSYESGRMKPKCDRMRKIAEILDTDEEYFFDSSLIESEKKIFFLLDELHDRGTDPAAIVTKWALLRGEKETEASKKATVSDDIRKLIYIAGLSGSVERSRAVKLVEMFMKLSEKEQRLILKFEDTIIRDFETT